VVVFLVLKTIIENRLTNQRIIISQSNLSERTVRNSLKKLLNLGIITQTINFSDLRFKFYKINRRYKKWKRT